MQVLLTLASEPGEVFTRETVQRLVWSDVVVGEDVLIRAIGKIRRGFNSERVIETVPKVGYRLVAPVVRESREELVIPAGDLDPRPPHTPLSDRMTGQIPAHIHHEDLGAAAPPAPESSAVSPPRLRRLIWWAAAAVLVLALGISATILRLGFGRPVQAGGYITRPFTTDPGSQIQASFSPDGNSVAYVWRRDGRSNGQIFVRPLNSEQSTGLSPDPSASQLSPVWSPDGRQIAFVRKDEKHSSIVVAPASGGPGKEVYTLPVNSAREYGGLSWSADGAGLIFPQQNTVEGASYLIELTLRDRTVKSVTASPLLWDGDFAPAVSPDGRTLAFIRGSEELARDIYVMSLPDGPIRRITQGYLAMSLAWADDSSSIVFSSSRNGALSLWRVRPDSGDPQRLAAVGDDAYAPAISLRNHRLIYSHGSAMWGIFALNLEDKSAQPGVILTSSEQDAAPRISPSGDKMIFQSWRSGSREIWSTHMDGSDPVQLTDSPGESAGDPSWSPNGASIAFDARLNSFSHIYILDVDGRKPRALTSGNFNDVAPNWTPDGHFVYFGSNRSGSWQIWRAPVDGSQPSQQVTSAGGIVAMVSPDGRKIYYSKYMTSGLWAQPITGGPERKLFDGPPAGYPEYWTLSRNDIYSLAMRGQQFEVSRVDDETRQSYPVDVLKSSPTVGLSISPDTKKMVFSGLISASSHLTLVEGFR
jgi:Tol biopolymer transport system component